MALEMLVGLEVTDPDAYRAYRAGMTPILQEYGGEFGYDLVVAEMLRSEVPEPINRVFTIRFPDQRRMERFFADEAYLAVKREHFEPAVAHTTIMARYER